MNIEPSHPYIGEDTTSAYIPLSPLSVSITNNVAPGRSVADRGRYIQMAAAAYECLLEKHRSSLTRVFQLTPTKFMARYDTLRWLTVELMGSGSVKVALCKANQQVVTHCFISFDKSQGMAVEMRVGFPENDNSTHQEKLRDYIRACSGEVQARVLDLFLRTGKEADDGLAVIKDYQSVQSDTTNT